MRTNRNGTARPGLLAVLLFLPSLVPALHAREVFIYYANETSPNEMEAANYAVIIDWLRSDDRPDVLSVAERLERDLREFPAVVDSEITALQYGMRDTGDELSAVVFTNRLVRNGRYLVFPGGTAEPLEAEICVRPHENYILASNPLCRADAFRRALAEVAARFDPASHVFVLLTKSHGNVEKAMMPRLAARHEQTNRDEILAIAGGEIAEDQMARWSASLGVTKEEYISILAEAGRRHGMQFSLVVMESCNGDIDETLTPNLPPNVRQLYNSGPRGAEYSNLDYEQLLAGDGDGNSLATLISGFLANRFQTLYHEPKRFPFYAMVLFLPLVTWLVRFMRRPRMRGASRLTRV